MTDQNTPSKILIVGPAWLGDIVMSQVALKQLRTQYPQAAMDMIVPAYARSVVRFMPEVRYMIDQPTGHGELGLLKRYRLARKLALQAYDLAIVLPHSFKSALIPYFAHIGRRRGFRGEWRYGILNDVRLFNKACCPTMVAQFAALAFPKGVSVPASLPSPCLDIDDDEVQMVLTKHQQLHLLNERKRLLLCPGAAYGDAKRWPVKHYAALARSYLDKGWQVCLRGSPQEQSIMEAIQNHVDRRCVDLSFLSLEAMVVLMSTMTAIVSNDSGLMHVAAALKRPLVAVFGSTSPEWTPPLSSCARVLSLGLACSPCFARQCPLEHKRCLEDITPDRVSVELEALLT